MLFWQEHSFVQQGIYNHWNTWSLSITSLNLVIDSLIYQNPIVIKYF